MVYFCRLQLFLSHNATKMIREILDGQNVYYLIPIYRFLISDILFSLKISTYISLLVSTLKFNGLFLNYIYIYIYIHIFLLFMHKKFQNKQRIINLHISRILINFKVTTFPSAHKHRYILYLLKQIQQQLQPICTSSLLHHNFSRR